MAKHHSKQVPDKKAKIKKKNATTKATTRNDGKWSTVNEDRRRARLVEQEAAAVKDENESSNKTSTNKTNSTPSQDQGAKIYACLRIDCESTFDTWRDALNHMGSCTLGEVPATATKGTKNKPDLNEARAKGNALLDEGKVKIKEYPIPTEEELRTAIGEYFEANPRKLKHGLAQVVAKIWGPGKFNRFGYGTYADFCDRHGFVFKS